MRDPDRADFTAYAAARYPALVRSAVLLGCSLPDAEDAAQDALVRCYVAWARVQRADDREAYVYRVLVNGLRRSHRRRWTGERATADPTGELTGATASPAAAAASSAAELRPTLLAALGSLPEEQRQVVVLRHLADLSEDQTATALGIPSGTVKSRAARALARLSEDPRLAALVHEEE